MKRTVTTPTGEMAVAAGTGPTVTASASMTGTGPREDGTSRKARFAGDAPTLLSSGMRVAIGSRTYLVKNTVGEGSSAVVYRLARHDVPGGPDPRRNADPMPEYSASMAFGSNARQLLLPDALALKVLRPECASPLRVERWLRESALLTELSHPNLLKGFAGGTLIARIGQPAGPSGQTGSAGKPALHFILTEFAEGQTLDRFAPEQLTLDRILRIGYELSCGLNYLYLDGRVSAHRDLKPANVMVDASGQVKLLDLGIAKTRLRFSMSLDTQTVGTLRYMAPEQFGDARHVDIRADLYALGVILYELLEGPRALDGASRQLMEQRFAQPHLALGAQARATWARSCGIAASDGAFDELGKVVELLTMVDLSARCQTPEESMRLLAHLMGVFGADGDAAPQTPVWAPDGVLPNQGVPRRAHRGFHKLLHLVRVAVGIVGLVVLNVIWALYSPLLIGLFEGFS